MRCQNKNPQYVKVDNAPSLNHDLNKRIIFYNLKFDNTAKSLYNCANLLSNHT